MKAILADEQARLSSIVEINLYKKWESFAIKNTNK